MLPFMSDQVRLRPVNEDDLTILEKLTQEPEATGEFAWFGWFDALRWRRTWAESRLLGADGGALMVVRGDDRLGFVTWQRRPATVAAPGSGALRDVAPTMLALMGVPQPAEMTGRNLVQFV